VGEWMGTLCVCHTKEANINYTDTAYQGSWSLRATDGISKPSERRHKSLQHRVAKYRPLDHSEDKVSMLQSSQVDVK
jgi:hypothetical protein